MRRFVCRVCCLRFLAQGLRCRVQGSRLRVRGVQLRADGMWLLVQVIQPDFIRASIYDKDLHSMKITTRLDHIIHCKTASDTNRSNRLTY